MNILPRLKVEKKNEEKKIVLRVNTRRGCALEYRDLNICRRFKVLEQCY